MRADLLLRNGLVREGGDEAPSPDRPEPARPIDVAIANGTVVAVGPTLSVTAEHTLDLSGTTIVPGFVDTHTHLSWAGAALLRVDVPHARTGEDLLTAVRGVAGRLPRGLWLRGGGWRRSALPDEALPDVATLDAAAGGHPLYLTDVEGTVAVCNSIAARLLRLAEHPEIPGGTIIPEAGRLYGAAVAHRGTSGVIPPAGRYGARAELAAALAELPRLGVTEVHDIATWPDDGRPPPPVYLERSFTDATLYGELAEAGPTPVRVGVRPTLHRWREFADGPRIPDVMGFKLFATAGGYSGPRGLTGVVFRYPGAAAASADARGAAAAGLPTSLHAIGDLDVTEAIEVIAAAGTPPGGRRHRLVHGQVVRPADVARLANLPAVAEVQPWAMVEAMPKLLAGLPPELARHAFPYRSLLRAGVPVLFGSDWRAADHADLREADPLLAMRLAVHRTDPVTGLDFGRDEAVTPAEALWCATSAGARYAGFGPRRGRIAVGYAADLVALSADPATPGPGLDDARVVVTVSQGSLTYQA
ncbi:amidohydrolase family protein [Micromonospora sp. NPDC050200]|uniref:amidohydrolase n=1 Tax=Micromonospora sp. NPDC050200 TaxID=3155664 RepID=UPI0033D8F12D